MHRAKLRLRMMVCGASLACCLASWKACWVTCSSRGPGAITSQVAWTVASVGGSLGPSFKSNCAALVRHPFLALRATASCVRRFMISRVSSLLGVFQSSARLSGLSRVGQASAWSGELASPTGANVRVTLAFPVSLALRLPRCRELPSWHRRLSGLVARSAAQLACRGTVVCGPLWVVPVATPSLAGDPEVLGPFLHVQPLRKLASRGCPLAHRAEAETARFAFPKAPAMCNRGTRLHGLC